MKRIAMAGLVVVATGVCVSCTRTQSPATPAQTVQEQSSVPESSGPLSPQAQQEAAELDSLPPVRPTLVVDTSGRKQAGKASYYGSKFDGRKMASGKKFDPEANVAASKSLPLGTTAKVTNTTTGKSAIVTVQDRGPHVAGRVIDVSPKVARTLDMTHKGVTSVVVKPIAEPKPDGGVKIGAGAAEASTDVVQRAVKTAQQAARSP